jgi:hypothetical protein
MEDGRGQGRVNLRQLLQHIYKMLNRSCLRPMQLLEWVKNSQTFSSSGRSKPFFDPVGIYAVDDQLARAQVLCSFK